MTKEQLKELVDKLIITDTSIYAYYTDEKHADALKNLTVKDLKNNGLITQVSATESELSQTSDSKVNTLAQVSAEPSQASTSEDIKGSTISNAPAMTSMPAKPTKSTSKSKTVKPAKVETETPAETSAK